MYCLAKYCYVCLTERNNLQYLDNTETTKVYLEKLNYCLFYVKWTNITNFVLICDECCKKLHIAYDFITMCRKNYTRMQGYITQLEHTTALSKNVETALNVTLIDVKKTKPNTTSISDNLLVENTYQYVEHIDKQAAINYDYLLKMEIKDEINSDDEVVNEDYLKMYPDVRFELLTFPSDCSETDSISIGDEYTEFTSSDIRISQEYNDDVKHKTDEFKVRRECDIYNSTFSHETENISLLLSNHATEKEDKSSVLSRQSKRKTNLKKLTVKSPHKCSFCSKCFIYKSELIQHEAFHTGKKRHKCSFCNKCYSRKTGLIKHETIYHTGAKQNECALCNKHFGSKAMLSEHEVVHTRDKPYECEICNNRFGRRSSLNRHKIIHTGERPYECSLCTRRFNVKSNLMEHMFGHTGESRFKCTVCSKSFSRKQYLDRHIKNHNAINVCD